uniref:Uncharacterized protein n=1 Tax=Ditylenchus dipsaci TaxID=166011 RepID=A0A915CQ00_9BILA
MEKDGFDQGYFNCSGCKAVNLANAVKVQVSSLKFNLTSSTWIDDPDQYNHICEPKATTTVTGTDLRRSFQAERAAGGGGQETSAAVRVRMDQRIVREHGNKTAQEQQEIRDAACGNVTATDAGLYRAKRKRFPNISTFNEFMAAENHRMRLTLRGLEATIGQIHFAEQLLLYGDADMLIFSSPTQLNLLRNCTTIISDGTFKFAPKNAKQIYRIFGLVRGTYATPLVTVLLNGKTTELYGRMWQQVRVGLGFINTIRYANFDAEVAAYSSFADGLYRKIQSIGLAIDYQDDADVRKFVRMIGAIQITPMVEWNTCLEMIRREIDEADLEADIKEKFLAFCSITSIATWMSKGEIFCLFGYTGLPSFQVGQLDRFISRVDTYRRTGCAKCLRRKTGRSTPRTWICRNRAGHHGCSGCVAYILSSDDGLLRGDRYYYKMHRYLKRMGKLMGIDFVDYRQLTAEEAEMHPAVEQALDENENDQQIEIQPVGMMRSSESRRGRTNSRAF